MRTYAIIRIIIQNSDCFSFLSLMQCVNLLIITIFRNNLYSFLLGLAEFIPDTVILGNKEKLIEYLPSFLDNRETSMKLCYRASEHDWSSATFHQKCDDRAGTVVLVKVGNWIFGGYTDQTWERKNFISI